jgi:hypothetical protein
MAGLENGSRGEEENPQEKKKITKNLQSELNLS